MLVTVIIVLYSVRQFLSDFFSPRYIANKLKIIHFTSQKNSDRSNYLFLNWPNATHTAFKRYSSLTSSPPLVFFMSLAKYSIIATAG